MATHRVISYDRIAVTLWLLGIIGLCLPLEPNLRHAVTIVCWGASLLVSFWPILLDYLKG